MQFSARNLLNMDLLSKSDPQCIVYMKESLGQHFHEIGRTEVIRDNLNPDFVHKILIDYNFEKVQYLKVSDQWFYIIIYHYIPLHIIAYLCMPVHTITYHCMSVHTIIILYGLDPLDLIFKLILFSFCCSSVWTIWYRHQWTRLFRRGMHYATWDCG